MLELPNLDDRSFDQLVEDARELIRRRSPEWTDLSVHDPGIVLVEVFAFLTEHLTYRLNRLPEKAYVAFLALLGVSLRPPSAARVTLAFTRSQTSGDLVVPAGTRVGAVRVDEGDPPVFATAAPLSFRDGTASGEVLAHHCEFVEGELLGHGTGQPYQTLTVARPPIIAPLGIDADLVLGVASATGEQGAGLRHGGEVFVLWQPVENFGSAAPDQRVYRIDRTSGRVTFGTGENGRPIPPPGRAVRLWYRRGGGAAGNVAAGQLTVLKDPLPGLQVTNPIAATGGRDAETVEAARRRGPDSFRSRQRAVTASDFESLARSAGGVARARAITRAALWRHARPGTVEVLLVPEVPGVDRDGRPVGRDEIAAQATEPLRRLVEAMLEERRPLGTRCVVAWARCKPVSIHAKVIVRAEEDERAVQRRIIERLHRTITPLPSRDGPGWSFGRSLRVYHVYDIVSNEPGVDYIEDVSLSVDEVPAGGISAVAADSFQASTWHLANGARLFRSMNDGIGWEPVATFPGEEIIRLRSHVDRPGLVAALGAPADDSAPERSCLHVSRDCGETWETVAETRFGVRDIAWSIRDGVPSLLLASDAGLYELTLRRGAVPLQVLVAADDPELGFFAVAAGGSARGDAYVAVAARGNRGVFLSGMAGEAGSFQPIGLTGRDVRTLALERQGPRTFLWAGEIAVGNDPGAGCHRRELIGVEDVPGGWSGFAQDWQGGGCNALAFGGGRVFAATDRSGIAILDPRRSETTWTVPRVTSGLAVRDRTRFQPLLGVAVGEDGTLVVCGGADGPRRSADGGDSYRDCAQAVFTDAVTLPPTWLFCSGRHEIATSEAHATLGD